jgi:hypothetical protein
MALSFHQAIQRVDLALNAAAGQLGEERGNLGNNREDPTLAPKLLN